MKINGKARYWNSRGAKYQTYSKLYDELVPDSGDAPWRAGEVLRMATNFYYDLYNNGGCNYSMSWFNEMYQNLNGLLVNREARQLLTKMFKSRNQITNVEADRFMDLCVAQAKAYLKDDKHE